MARFELYVKQSSDGGDCGSCPFCMRVYMFMLTKMKKDQIRTVPVDLANKTDDFLVLNPAGTTPVLIDHGADDKVIGDSGLIIEYIESLYPEPCMNISTSGPAADATKNLLGKFAAYMKNQDLSKSKDLRQAFLLEVQKLEDYLQNEGKGMLFLLGNGICEIDCTVYPRLLQIKVAGGELKGVDIPVSFPAINSYMSRVEETAQCVSTRPTAEDLVEGWMRHGAIKEC